MRKLVLAALILVILTPTRGLAEEEAAKKGPFKKPKFILEPDKRPEEVVDPDTYVDGAEEPPGPVIPILAQRTDTDRESQLRLGLGICYVSSSSDGHFVNSVTSRDLSATSTLQLCVEGRGFYRPAASPVSVRAVASYGNGRASLNTSVGAAPILLDANISELSARVELGLHLWSKTGADGSLYEFSLLGGGATLGMASPTMAVATTTPSIESRRIMAVPAGAAFRVSPSPNWFAEIAYRRFFWLKATGAGALTASGASHSQIELDAFRYVARDWALRITGAYDWRSVTWTATLPDAHVETHSQSRVSFSLAIVRTF